MSLEKCERLLQVITDKINSWSIESTNNTLISNLSNNISYISNNISSNIYNISANFSGTKVQSDSNAVKTANGTIKCLPTGNGNTTNGSKSSKSNSPSTSPKHENGSISQVNSGQKIEEDLLILIQKLYEQAVFLHEKAQKYDYTGQKVNGYYSMLLILQRYFEHFIKQMEKRKCKFAEFYEVGNLLLIVLSAMEDYAKKYDSLKQIFDNKPTDEKFRLNETDHGKKINKLDKIEKTDTTINELSSNDSEDETEEDNKYTNISCNLVKMSSNLANSIESMKSHCDDVYEDLANNNGNFSNESEDENDDKEVKISDYYLNNKLNDNEFIEKEYGKEIKKEEYERWVYKYYKRFNFNFKMSKSNNCTSPVNEETSPKKTLANLNDFKRPDSPKKTKALKYYKYFSSLTKNFEENFNFSKSSNISKSSSKQTIDDNSLSTKVFSEDSDDEIETIGDDTQEPEIEETESEIMKRNELLDEYILSRFQDTNDELHLVTPPMLYFYEGFTLTLNCEKPLSLIYGRIGAFWYCKSAANVFNLVRNLIVILTSPPSKSIASLCNTDYCGRVFAHKQVNSTLDSLMNGLANLELKYYNRGYFKLLYKEYVVYGKTIKMKVFSEFNIHKNKNKLIKTNINKSDENLSNCQICGINLNENLDHVKENCSKSKDFSEVIAEGNEANKLDGQNISNEDSSESEELKIPCEHASRIVRCRLINYVRNQNESEICENSDKCLLFHVHGGGFVLSSPDSHELYLRDWAIQLKGIPILSVDYILREKYPRAPQDILDVYMTLVDPKNQQLITELIGFQPEKIIIAGDSAGANLALSLLCCLNDIRNEYPEYSNLKMPISIIGIYGAFDIRAVMSPSKFISSIDPILHHGNIMAMVGTYAGIAQKIRKTIWARIKHRKSNAWYRVSEKKLKSRFKDLSEAMESYYASPLIYPKFEDFEDISLHLITTHLCPLVDDSVVLYKVWKGEKTFDVFDGLPHAFLNFSDKSEDAKKASKKCIERIVEAFKKKAI